MATVEDKIEFRAQARWVRTTPRKAQLVVEEIRGRTVPEAQVILAFMTRAAAKDVASVLNSAVANAESHPLSTYAGDDLYVSAAEVGAGPTLKRWRARARGRVGRIKKRTCHITIRLEPIEGAIAMPPSVEERPKRARKPKAEATPAIEAATRVEEAPAPAEAELEAPAETEAEAPAPEGETPADETHEAGDEAKAEEPPAEEAQAEAKPKRAPRPRKKPAEPATEASAAEQPAAAEPKPKPKPARTRKKAEEPAPESPSGEES